MLFLKRIFYCVFLLFPFLLKAQELQKDSIEFQILKFLLSTNDAGSSQNIDALFFYDYLKDSATKSLSPLSKDSVSFYGFWTLMLPRYGHFLISYNKKSYIINMRKPLKPILEELNWHFSRSIFFTEDIQTNILRVIKQAHRGNWEMNHGDEQYYIDEDGLFQPVIYDPLKW